MKLEQNTFAQKEQRTVIALSFSQNELADEQFSLLSGNIATAAQLFITCV